MHTWADHLLWYKDFRFSNHPFFIFIVHTIAVRKMTLEKSNYIVRQKLGESHLSIEDLKGLLYNENFLATT